MWISTRFVLSAIITIQHISIAFKPHTNTLMMQIVDKKKFHDKEKKLLTLL